MMVQLFENCFGLTRGGDGVPQEVVGPVANDGIGYSVRHRLNGKFRGMWRTDGRADMFAARSDDNPPYDLVAVFPDRTSAEAALAGGEPLPGGEALDMNALPLGLYIIHWKSGGSSEAAVGMAPGGTRWIAPTNWVQSALATEVDWDEVAKVERIPRHAEPAQAGVDWEQRRWDLIRDLAPEMLKAFGQDIGKEPQGYGESIVTQRTVNIADALIAAAKGGQP